MMFLVRFERYNNQVTNFLKRAAILSKKLGQDICGRFFQPETISLSKNFGFLNCFRGTKVTTLMCG